MSEIVLRRATAADHEAIVALVVRVLTDIDYASMSPAFAAALASNPRALASGPWVLGHIAVVDSHVRGIVLTDRDTVDDLWLDRAVRRQGVGGALLDIALQEIRQRGHRVAKLRVVAGNTNAIAFYLARGWREVERVPHARFGFDMVCMERPL